MKHPKTYAAYLCAALMAFLAGGCELSNETTTAHDSGVVSVFCRFFEAYFKTYCGWHKI